MLEVLYYPDMEPPSVWLRSYSLFFDSIRSLVPVDARNSLSPDIRRFADELPGVYIPFAFKASAAALSDINLKRLSKIFGEISTSQKEADTKMIYLVIKGSSVGIRDHVLMHNEKISSPVRKLLQEHHLIGPHGFIEVDLFRNQLDVDNYTIVNRKASDIILSHIANRFAQDKGWSSLTNQEISFSFTALDSLKQSALQNAVDALASAIISVEIPEEIQSIKLDEFKKLRDAFSDVRLPFQDLLFRLAQIGRLSGISNVVDFQTRISEICTEFDAAVQKFKKTSFASKFRRWVPLSVGGLATLAGPIFGGALVTIASASVNVVTQMISSIKPSKPTFFGDENIYRMIAKLQKEVPKMSLVKKLI